MVICEISIVPLGTGTTSLSAYVADCHRILESQSRVRYQLTPMGTILEGNLEDILQLAARLHEVPFERGARRAVMTLKVDDRRDRDASMDAKVQSVQEQLKENLP